MKKGQTITELPVKKFIKFPRKLREAKNLVPFYKELGLKPQHIQFVAEYLTNGNNATEAYLKTSTTQSNKVASSRGYKLLNNPNIKEAIRRFISNYLEERKSQLDKRIIDILSVQAFYDPSDFISPTGQPIFETWDQIPKHLRVVVEGADTKFYGKDANINITSLKLVDRHKAIKELIDLIKMGQPSYHKHTIEGGNKPLEHHTVNVHVEAKPETGLENISEMDLIRMLKEFDTYKAKNTSSKGSNTK